MARECAHCHRVGKLLMPVRLECLDVPFTAHLCLSCRLDINMHELLRGYCNLVREDGRAMLPRRYMLSEAATTPRPFLFGRRS